MVQTHVPYRDWNRTTGPSVDPSLSVSGGPPCPSTGMNPVEVNNNTPIRVNIRVKLLLGLLGLNTIVAGMAPANLNFFVKISFLLPF